MTLLRATIHVDGLAYQGEDIDRTYPSPGPAAGGFHTYTGEDINVLKFGESDPHVIEGHRNLASHIQTIMRRVQDGHVTATRIVIEIEN